MCGAFSLLGIVCALPVIRCIRWIALFHEGTQRSRNVRRPVAHECLLCPELKQPRKVRHTDHGDADVDARVVLEDVIHAVSAHGLARDAPRGNLAVIVWEEISREEIYEKGDVGRCAEDGSVQVHGVLFVALAPSLLSDLVREAVAVVAGVEADHEEFAGSRTAAGARTLRRTTTRTFVHPATHVVVRLCRASAAMDVDRDADRGGLRSGRSRRGRGEL